MKHPLTGLHPTSAASAGSTLALLLVLFATAGPIASGATVRVSAAASLANALQELAPAYERQTGDRLVFNFAASGLLARQIEEGAPADVFISADESRMNALETKGLIVKETRRSRLSNTLVIVVPSDAPSPGIRVAPDLATPAVRRLALGDPKTVPAGTYAQKYLEGLKLWDGVKAKVVPFDNVRSALAAVASGNVDAGIVYATDTASTRTVRVAVAVKAADGPPIRYPMSLLRDAREPAAARRWLAHLESKEAAAAFEHAGFTVIPPGVAQSGATPRTP